MLCARHHPVSFPVSFYKIDWAPNQGFETFEISLKRQGCETHKDHTPRVEHDTNCRFCSNSKQISSLSIFVDAYMSYIQNGKEPRACTPFLVGERVLPFLNRIERL